MRTSTTLLYEVVWKDRPLAQGVVPADFMPEPGAVAPRSRLFASYLEETWASMHAAGPIS